MTDRKVTVNEADVREGVAHEIWAYTGNGEDCPFDGPYEPCEMCMDGIYLPAADAVIARINDILTEGTND